MTETDHRRYRAIARQRHDSCSRVDTFNMRDVRPSVALYDLLDEIGASTGLETTLGLLDCRLRRLLPYDGMAVFLRGEERLFPAYVSGEECPPGEGIAGVAETRRPVFNRDPEPKTHGAYRSMIAVPLDDDLGLVGVLTLYSLEAGAFEATDLGVLLLIRADLAASLRKALADRFATELARLAAAVLEAVDLPVKQTA